MGKTARLSIIFFLILVLIASMGCQKGENKPTGNQLDNGQKELPKDDTTPQQSQEQKNDQENTAKEAAKPAEKIEEKPTNIEFMFMGDVMLDSYMADYIREYGVDYPWKDVAPITNQADFSVVNLETSVSTRGATKKPKGFGFRSAPYTLEGLTNSGIDLVTLANNHVKDYGDEAFFDTLAHLEEFGISYVGAGENVTAAEQAYITEKEGVRVGFLSYTSILPWQGWEAGEDSPGVAALRPKEDERLLENIKATAEKTDITVVILHWGTEYKEAPNDWQIELAHKMIDHGADLIVGHHPHVLQGIEFYKGKPILYSIGNFIFLKKNDHAGETGIFKLVLNKDGFVEGRIYPVYIQYTKANLLDDNNPLKKQIINNLHDLSKDFNTTVDKNGAFQGI